MTRIFEQRDDHFDLCSVFLVVTMIISHSFQVFYVNDYNRNITYYCPIGFVFLAGFISSAINASKMRKQVRSTIQAIITRAAKIFTLFLIPNFFLTLYNISMPLATSQPINNVSQFIVAIFLGTEQKTYAFDILIPIGLTMLLSVLILVLLKKPLYLLVLLVVLLIIHVFSKWIYITSSYGVSLILIGCVGNILGTLSTFLDWNKFIKWINDRRYIIMSGYLFLAAFFILIAFGIKGHSKYFYYQFIPTVILLFAVYCTSYRYQLEKYRIIRILQKTYSKHMLFSYMFHIILLRVSLLKLQNDSYSFTATVLLAMLMLVITVIACHVLNIFMGRSPLVNKTYSLIFK